MNPIHEFQELEMTEKKNIRGTEALLLALIEEGVDTVFGYPGGAIMPLYDELYDYGDRIRHILVRHEQGAVHAAQGYARSSGRTGVCMATAGPGATNFVTGIADAMLDSTPLVCITAQVGKENLGTGFFQEADMINITLPITKWSYQITTAEEIPETVAKAFHIASSGRPGPVVISFTKNAQVERLDFRYDRNSFLSGFREAGRSCRQDMYGMQKAPETGSPVAGQCSDGMPDIPVSCSPGILRQGNAAGYGLSGEAASIARMLNAAERPVIIAGHGVILSGAENVLLELAEAGNIPVATTLLGLSSFPTGHPLWLGNVGMHGHLAANRMVQKSDLVMAVGMRFSDRTTGAPSGFAPEARIVHIDIDASEIGKNVRTDVALIADAKTALEAVMASGVRYSGRQEWLSLAGEYRHEEDMTIRKRDMEGEEPVAGSGRRDGYIRMGQTVEAVSRLAGEDAVIVSDVGQNQLFAARYSRFGKSGKWVTSGGLGTMGFGLPAAIGAKIANPDRQVVAFLGDGGFQMTIQELGTLMQTGAAVKIVLLDNTWLGMVRQWQELFYDRRYACTHLENPDFVQLVSSYGIHASRVTERAGLDSAVRELLEYEGPAFLDVAVDPGENVFPMVPAGAGLDDIMTGTGL